MVDDFHNGYLLPVGDTAAMARAALSLLNDPQRLVEFKKAAAERALSKFSADRIVKQYEDYYQEIYDA